MTYAIDPELLPILELFPELDFSDPLKCRSELDALRAALDIELDTTGVRIDNLEIPGPEGAPTVPVRTYTPDGLDRPVPGLLQIHGGGFVIGDLDTEQGQCVALCRNLGVVVVSVDYRLAPETPFPGGLEDCFAALTWVSAHSNELQLDPARLGIIGTSAGGGLAAATALLARDRGGPALCFQYLGVPELDDRLDTPSMRRFTDTPMWHRPNAERSWDFYLGSGYRRGADDVPPYAAPARAEDLAGLPPAYVSTMEFDPLRDEGVLYALKLMQAGVPTELHSFPGTFHGSGLMATARVSQREAAEMFAVLSRGLGLDT